MLKKKYKICVVGCGYVGMSIGLLLSKNSQVTFFDIDKERIDKINNQQPTVKDSLMEKYIKDNNLSMNATSDKIEAYHNADFILTCLPTNYDEKLNAFNLDVLNNAILDALQINHSATIVIKSTIPVGHSDHLNSLYKTSRIIFSPEFLTEGNALHDNLFPSRIIVGGSCSAGDEFGAMLKDAAAADDIKLLKTSNSEAEAIKLLSNTYLAMRVAFFNELDTYAYSLSLDTKNIIEGICHDPRIGNIYNNPSFGYGGYCLPKDTKQLIASFPKKYAHIVKAIDSSNESRKDFIVDIVDSIKPKTIGIYKLAMKSQSDNSRNSAIIDILKRLERKKYSILIYEPSIKKNKYENYNLENDLNKFKLKSDLILANRQCNDLIDISEKVLSRDVFNNN